jgi:hypothetical protein
MGQALSGAGGEFMEELKGILSAIVEKYELKALAITRQSLRVFPSVSIEEIP